MNSTPVSPISYLEGWNKEEQYGETSFRWMRKLGQISLPKDSVGKTLVIEYDYPADAIKLPKLSVIAAGKTVKVIPISSGHNYAMIPVSETMFAAPSLDLEVDALYPVVADLRELGLKVHSIILEGDRRWAVKQGEFQIYSGYTEEETSIIFEFQNTKVSPTPGYITDFIGTKISTDIIWGQAASLGGHVLPPPIPADFHAEAIEWIGVLKAVKDAKESFTVLELGAGFGMWAVCSAIAARNKGISDIKIHIVEGDPRHCKSAIKHFHDNGFDNCAGNILNIAVGAQDGMARWPKTIDHVSLDKWDHRPDLDNSGDYLGRNHDEMMDVQVVSLKNLLKREPMWNLLHIDIQGHEVDVVRSCIDDVCKKVKWIVVGTHSRKLDGDFIDMMFKAGWMLENEKPCKFLWDATFPTLEGMTLMDGTQVWRNPKIL